MKAGKLLIVGGALALSACGSMFDVPNFDIYTISVKGDAGLANEGPVVFVSEPSLPGEVSERKIPVRVGDHSLSFLENSRWSESMSNLMHRYITYHLAGAVPAQIIGKNALDVRADCRLGLEVQRLDYSPDEAAIVFYATARLTSMNTGKLLSAKQIVGDSPVMADSADDIVEGYNQAVSDISVQLAAWLETTVSGCSASD